MLQINKKYHSHAFDYRIKFLILHYTAGNFRSSMDILINKLSSHYLIPLSQTDDSSYPYEKVDIFQLVDEKNRAWHAGQSKFHNRTNLNDTSIGIEIVNLTNNIDHPIPYPLYQINLLIPLCQKIIAQYKIPAQNVLGHSDIAFERKQDPGARFPWKKLYQQGIGAWYDEKTAQKYVCALKNKKIDIHLALDKLYEYGYRSQNNKKLNTQKLIQAFQMHFRPHQYDGNLDIETAAYMFALWEKYSPFFKSIIL